MTTSAPVRRRPVRSIFAPLAAMVTGFLGARAKVAPEATAPDTKAPSRERLAFFTPRVHGTARTHALPRAYPTRGRALAGNGTLLTRSAVDFPGVSRALRRALTGKRRPLRAEERTAARDVVAAKLAGTSERDAVLAAVASLRGTRG